MIYSFSHFLPLLFSCIRCSFEENTKKFIVYLINLSDSNKFIFLFFNFGDIFLSAHNVWMLSFSVWIRACLQKSSFKFKQTKLALEILRINTFWKYYLTREKYFECLIPDFVNLQMLALIMKDRTIHVLEHLIIVSKAREWCYRNLSGVLGIQKSRLLKFLNCLWDYLWKRKPFLINDS